MPLEQPILPVKILKNGGYLAIVAVACIGQMVYFALAIIWPQQIQYSYTTNNISIGWMSLTSGLSLITAEVVFGALMKVIGNTRLQLIFASCGLFAFLAAIGGTTHMSQNYPIAVRLPSPRVPRACVHRLTTRCCSSPPWQASSPAGSTSLPSSPTASSTSPATWVLLTDSWVL